MGQKKRPVVFKITSFSRFQINSTIAQARLTSCGRLHRDTDSNATRTGLVGFSARKDRDGGSFNTTRVLRIHAPQERVHQSHHPARLHQNTPLKRPAKRLTYLLFIKRQLHTLKSTDNV
jgi:hypothetical protein